MSIMNGQKPMKKFPLTQVQRAYLMGRNTGFDMGGISTQVYYEFESDLEIERFNKALNQVIQAQPMLRAIIEDVGGQIILDEVPEYSIGAADLSGFTDEQQGAFIAAKRAQVSQVVFQHDRWPLFRFEAAVLNNQKTYLFCACDLLIADGYSLAVLISEIMDCYQTGRMPRPLPVSFRDYVGSLAELRHSKRYEKDKGYWLGKLEDFPSYPMIPLSKPPQSAGATTTRLELKMPGEAWQRLKKISLSKGMTPTVLVCSAYALVMSYWSNQKSLTINMPITGRSVKKGSDRVIGDYTRILLLPIDWGGIDSFCFWSYAAAVDRTIKASYRHAAFDGLEIIKELSRQNSFSSAAVMPIVFTSMLFRDDVFNNLTRMGEIKYSISRTPQVYLDCQVMEVRGELVITWDYADQYIDGVTAGKMFGQFSNLLSLIDEEGRDWGKALEPDPEDLDLLRRYNATAQNIPPTTLQELLRANFRRYGEKTAVRDGAAALTYGQLDAWSDRVARDLGRRNIGRGDLVGVIAERRIQTVVNIMGIIKSGAAYVPIAPDYPQARRDYMLKNSGCRDCLTPADAGRIQSGPAEVEAAAAGSEPAGVGESGFTAAVPGDTAYVIYTSGSTGEPKGVEITHDAVCNTIIAVNEKWKVTADDVIIGLSSFCFDLSVYDMFGALSSGAELVLIPDIRDIPRIVEVVKDNGITIWNSVPAVINLLVEELERKGVPLAGSSLRLCLLSGDWIPVTLPSALKKWFPACETVSLGGATEGSIWSVFYEIKESCSERPAIPYGTPLANQAMHILNDDLKPCPLGVTGEIYIGGRGVAKSYYNNPAKTRTSFIETPALGRLYKTGDFGRMLPEGLMEFLGRKDFQVKIGGHRIELSEIEAVLCRYKGIHQAAATVEKSASGQELICIFYAGDHEVNQRELAEHLGNYLPYYMMPQYYFKIEAVPLTANGKVNKKALKPPADGMKMTAAAPPGSDLEKRLAAIWKQVLKLDDVPVNVSFFGLGGDSIAMVQLLAEIKAQLGQEISYQKFVQFSSVEEVAKIIEGSGDSALKDDEVMFHSNPAAKWEAFPLSELQESYFIGRNSEAEYKGIVTNGYIELECNPYDHEKMRRVIQKLIDRHDMLRCAISRDGRQRFLPVVDWEIPLADKTRTPPAELERYLLEVRAQMLGLTLDLEKPPLLALQATLTAPSRAILHIYVDGLIIDGWSYEVFHSELEILYRDEGVSFPALAVTFKDYVEYKGAQKKTARYQRDKEYWLAKIGDIPEAATLPQLKPLQELETIAGIQIPCGLSLEEWRALEEKAAAFGVSGFAVLLSSFAAVIARWNYKQKFLLNIPEFDRPKFHPDADKIMGICSSFLLFTVDNQKEPFIDKVLRNQEQLWELKSHNTFSGMEVLREIYKRNNTFTNALVPIVFGMMAETPQLEKELLKVRYQENHTSQIWIDINTVLYNDGIEFNWNCVKGHMETKMLETMVELQKGILREAAYNREFWDLPVELPLPAEERKIIARANDTARRIEYQSFGKVMADSFRKNAGRTLIVTDTQTYTYAEIQQWVRGMQSKLVSLGLKPGDIAGICMGKSVEQIVAVLAVVSLGAVYMPVEYTYPDRLVLNCLRAVKSRILLTTRQKAEGFKAEGIMTLVPTLEKETSEMTGPEPAGADEDAILALIHTSGSTGVPKAVPISHKGLFNAIQFTVEKFGIGAEDQVLALTNLAHDMSMFDIFGMIYAGGSIALPQEEGARDPAHWQMLMGRQRVTIWNSVPAMLDMLFESAGGTIPHGLASLRLIISGGDYLHLKTAQMILETLPKARLVNVGGPTETTLWNIYHEVAAEDIQKAVIPYGKPIRNTKYYVLNENLEQVPVGVTGMMYCAGAGVTKGYAADRSATAARYFRYERTGEWLYKTGDLGKYDAGGNLHFMGREDFQVKILGKRIELEGIAAVIREVEGVMVSAAKLGKDKQSILAYYVSRAVVPEDVLAEKVRANLPDYMLPRHFIRLETMPLTANGKIDRKALPEGLAAQQSEPLKVKSLPRDEMEGKLVEVYSEMLGTEVDIDADFFMMGGNSLLAVKTVARIREECRIDISLTEMFTTSTIRELYDLIREKMPKAKEGIGA
ncbi:non-ribosomal peptide synthetase [Desulfosporosinus youngiae]|uniref:Amino acid adenylation enzyme/thioester reductase family protein n=1 Tax=Desulfosporosinus youngiae DSM 17734 TaxID=768710 RepID=H5XU21_9FIRM|nr:non-ribosomal peptide synthetase [Desulfosporosinus youngiae]EHQ88979.1 amino acid adenylation enzyme/thioester reductase family protein [Desulfosporosinus youngiae DSM 17734]